MSVLGYRPMYLSDGRQAALALIRGAFPGVGRLTARATVLAPGVDEGFVREALRCLGRSHISYVKVGDTMWGLPADAPWMTWAAPGTRVVTRHTFALDLAQGADALLKKQDVSVRTSIRRAERSGVKVHEITSPDDLEKYCTLAGETSGRIRAFASYTDFPAEFFVRLQTHMAPTGAAKMYLAYHDDVPLAGAIFLCGRGRIVYFAGASTRERRWTSLQAPTAILWHAMREAMDVGMTTFDLGGCTPTDDPRDPRYGVYAFKKRWGGQLETFYNLEVVLSRLPFYLQEHVISPLWDRLHPLYFRFVRGGAR